MILYKTKSKDELADIIYGKKGFPKLEVNNENKSFIGFHYLSYVDLNNYWCKAKFIVAFKNNEKAKNIIGAISYQEYGDNPYNYIGINYIDVREDYKRHGIATEMIKVLNNILSKRDILVLSMLSEEGKIAKIDDVFFKYINKCPLYRSSEELKLEIFKNRKLS